MYGKQYRCERIVSGRWRSAVIATLLSAALASGQNLLAVLDLGNDGSVAKSQVIGISDKISAEIAKDSTYMQFERALLPELLRQLYIEESATACSDPQCLTVIGSLIGANFVVGGSIRNSGKITAIELNLVEVEKKKALNTATLRTKASVDVLLESEIPALVRTLMNPQKFGSPIATLSQEKKGFLANPLLYIGTGLAGAAAGGAYYYFNYYKQPGADEDKNLSLDDAPSRRR